MSSSEDIQRNVLGVVGSAIKSTAATTKVDTNQVLFELSSRWGSLGAGDVLDLQPLYAMLMARGVVPNDAATVCLLVHKREDRVGLKVKLPGLVETLPTNVKADLLGAVPKVAATGLTNAARVGTSPGTPAGRTPTALPPAGRSSTSLPAAPAGRVPTAVLPFTPAAAAGKSAVNPLVVVMALLGLATAAGVYFAFREPPPKIEKIALPAGLPAFTVVRDAHNLHLYDSEKDFKRPFLELLLWEPKIKTLITGDVDRVLLCRSGQERCRAVIAAYRPNGILWMDPALQKDAAAHRAASAPPPPEPPPAQ